MNHRFISIQVQYSDADFWTMRLHAEGPQREMANASRALEEHMYAIIASSDPVHADNEFYLKNFLCTGRWTGGHAVFEVEVDTKGGPAAFSLLRMIRAAIEGQRVLATNHFVVSELTIDAE